jgi:hypothetical protein
MITVTEARTKAGLVKLRAIAKQKNACADALNYMDECIAEGRSLNSGMTLMETRLGPDVTCGWFLWARTTFPELLNTTIKRFYTDRITRDNPRIAAHLDLCCADLDPVEVALVQSRWTAEQLPNIARQLAEGVISRPAR